jgi:catechol-2,3-dioxygenase
MMKRNGMKHDDTNEGSIETMHITELMLQTHDLAAQRDFYEHTLELPVLASSEQAFTVQAGTTRLTFQTTEQKDALYHVAFTVPRNKTVQAKLWGTARFPLLTDPAGLEEFAGGSWNSWSIYFRDPANNILEFIAHYDLDRETSGDFGAQDILHVSEIGLPVDDVPAQVNHLQALLGVEPYKGQRYDSFTPVGDIYGLFIVVSTGRLWVPDMTSPATIAPTAVTVEGTEEQHYTLAPLPYDVHVTQSSKIYERHAI